MTTVCLILFNRPGLTQATFERVAAARPRRLLLAADGPRAEVPGDQLLCERARAVVERVDWPCDVSRDLSDAHLGPERRVTSAIDMACLIDDAVIVVEDDCVVDPTFFEFCEALLERYRDDERIMSICGTSYLPAASADGSYYFSRYPACWGWATWRRAWNLYDPCLTEWPKLRQTSWLLELVGSRAGAAYWKRIFDSVPTNPAWDSIWLYSCWVQHALAILPGTNLVSNVGWGSEATHTVTYNPALARLSTNSMDFPLVHPAAMLPNSAADLHRLQVVFGVLETDLRSRVTRVGRRELGRLAERLSLRRKQPSLSFDEQRRESRVTP